MSYLRLMRGATAGAMLENEGIITGYGLKYKLNKRSDQSAMRWCGRMERMNKKSW